MAWVVPFGYAPPVSPAVFVSLLVFLFVFLFVFTFVYDGDDRVGLCQDGMYLLSMLPINCCPLMHLYSFPFKQHQLFLFEKYFLIVR